MATINVTLTGVSIKSFSRNHKHGSIKFEANLTKEFSTKMGWGEISAGQTGCTMEGNILSASLILGSDQQELFAKGEARFEVQEVDKFSILRLELKNKKGKGYRFVVDFEATFVKEGTAAIAESWLASVGAGTGKMKISGTLVEAKQEETGE